MQQSTKIFEAISNTTRRRILAFLSRTDLSAGEIAERFDMSKPTISRHLDVLENARLITSRRQGQFIYYHLNREHLVSNMYDFLADFCPISSKLKKESVARAKRKKGEGSASNAT